MCSDDLDEIERIYNVHGPSESAETWKPQVLELLAGEPRTVALVAVLEGGAVAGYIVGEIRVWEFGSAPAGWIFALGVDPQFARQGLGRELRDRAIKRFDELGARIVRTMVKRDDVDVLRFFRDGGFRSGSYVELEVEPSGASEER